MSYSVLNVLDTPPFPEWLLNSLQSWNIYCAQVEKERKQVSAQLASVRLVEYLNVIRDQITQYRSEAEKQAEQALEREIMYQRWGKEPTSIPSHRPLFNDNSDDVLTLISKMKNTAEEIAANELSTEGFTNRVTDFHREHIDPLLTRYRDQIQSFHLYQRALRRGQNPKTQLGKCLPIAQAVFASHLPLGNVGMGVNRVTQFMTMWGSTSLGFGGIGGAAMTEAVTTAIEHPTGMTCVFYGDQFAFFVKTPNVTMQHHLEQGIIFSVKDAANYEGEA